VSWPCSRALGMLFDFPAFGGSSTEMPDVPALGKCIANPGRCCLWRLLVMSRPGGK